MKRLLILSIMLLLLTMAGAVAQTTPEQEATPTENTEESEKVPRVYPIAPGVWYPGEPLPEKPFRYYRMRCWPGCHHDSEYGKYPDLPEKDKAEQTGESEKVPRVYPIAAGVWYPGEPLPEKPFRYYRMRCWPGCHHNSEYGKYPDSPDEEEGSM